VHVCGSTAGEKADVPRPEPEGAINYPADQQDDTDAYDDNVVNEDEEAGLLKDDQPGAHQVAFADVGLQPSVTQLAPESLLPAKEDTPQRPLIGVGRSDVVASPSMDRMSSDTALSPSQTSIVSQTRQHRPTDTEDSYAGTDRNYTSTRRALQKLQRKRQLQKQQTDTSTDEDRRTSFDDSGRRFPSMRQSLTPETIITIEDTLTAGRSSTSTFLFDSESSESDVGVVRTLTLRSIAKMKREKSRQSPPLIVLTEPESLVSEPETVTMPMTARDMSPSLSRTPQPPQPFQPPPPSQTPDAPLTQSSIDRTKTALSSPVVPTVPTTPSPAPPSDRSVDIQPDSQTAPRSRTATPASQVFPASPAVSDRQPTPVAQPSAVSQAGPPSQSVQVSIDKMKDVQKVERTDADGRKTTLYKLTPKAGSLFPFAAPNLRPTSFDQGAFGSQATAASIRLGESRDALAKVSLASAADRQTIHRLKTLADQRGEVVMETVLQEIQGTSARPHVRSTGLAQVSALQEPLVKTASEDGSGSLPFSAPGRLTYAPFRPEEPQTLVSTLTRASGQQLLDGSGDIGFGDQSLYHHSESGGLFKPGASISLSNFPHLSGERSHAELTQRLTFDVSVPDASNDANRATSQFLQDRFNSQKRCFKGLTDSSPSQAYLNDIPYEGLQPETKSLLNRISKVGMTSETAQSLSELQRIRSSFSSDQHPSQARLDYPQQPSATKLEQVGQRFSYLPSNLAQLDEYLHPSVSRITPADMSKPDEFLHPSLHRMTSASIPARPDYPQRPSSNRLARSEIDQKQMVDFSLDMSKRDEFLHPSMHRMPSSSGMIPARPDDALHSSDTKLRSATSHIAKYDEALHPSLSRLQTRATSQTSQVPAKLDDYLHPSLTQVRLKSSGLVTGSGRLHTDVDATTTTTTVMDREYFLYDQPARPDDILHPSSTRIASGDSTRSEFTRGDAGGTELQTSVPARPDDIIHPSSTRFSTRDHAKATSVTASTGDTMQGSSVRQEDVRHPSFASLPARDTQLRTKLADTATSTTSLDKEETLPSIPARTDDILHPSSMQFPPRVSARSTLDSATSTTDVDKKKSLSPVPAVPTHFPSQESTTARSTVDTATSATAVSRKETLPSESTRPPERIHPASRQGSTRDSARATLDSATSTTALGREETSPSVPARPDDIIHPSATQFPPRESVLQRRDRTRATLDAATSTPVLDETAQRSSTQFQQPSNIRATLDSTPSTASLDRKETFQAGRLDDTVHPSSTHFLPHTFDSTTAITAPDRKESLPVSARSGDTIHPSSTQFRSRDSVRGAFDTATSDTAFGETETLSSVTARPDDTTYPSHAQFLPHEIPRARSTFDTAVSSTTLPDTSTRSSDRMDSSSTQFRGTFDAATSTTSFGRKETSSIPARPDDIMHPSATQFRPSERTRGTLDSSTSATVLGRKETSKSVFVRPDEMTHPQRDSTAGTFDTETSATTLGSKESFDNVLHTSSSVGFTARDGTGGILDRPATSTSQVMGYDDWQTVQSAEWMTDAVDEVPSSLQRRSDLRPSEGQYQTSPLAGPEASYPSEFMHPSLTAVGIDRAVSDSAGRPSSVRITDQDISGEGLGRGSRFSQDDVRHTEAEAIDDDRRLSDRRGIIYRDEVRSGSIDLPTERRRSSMKTVSEQRQTPSATAPEALSKTDTTRQRRTVTWAPSPPAKSDIDAEQTDLVLFGGQRSLPDIRDTDSLSRDSISAASAPSAVMTDWSHGRMSGAERKSTTSDVTLTSNIKARDSRSVTREHFAKKKQQEGTARSEEHSYDTTVERQRQLEAATIEDKPAQYTSSSYVTPQERRSSDKATAVRIDREAAAADDAPLRQFDSSCARDVSSVVDLNQFVETEDWLLECPSASVSRPPSSRGFTTRSATPTRADEHGGACRHIDTGICEQQTPLTVDDRLACTTSYAQFETTPSRRSCGCDVTNSTTRYDVAVCSHVQPTSRTACTFTQSHATQTPPARGTFPALDPHRVPPGASRNYTDCHTRLTDIRTTTYGRDQCSANLGVYQSPFAKGFVPSTGSTRPSYQPCQSSRQPPAQQVRYVSYTL